ncbi:hypothetical protein AVEN_196560-1 [Araneus ventricosus]|uniref:Uncharacterized protein n=1 Tax=Araneus ventricosus TaxID=182803 RepID=A0A4Y1ZS86_ARAVE|nr:hypothetical protein AVEN_196560-1 [Araneus ventricosus]
MCCLAKVLPYAIEAGCWRTSLFSSKLYIQMWSSSPEGLKKAAYSILLEVGLVTLTSRLSNTRAIFGTDLVSLDRSPIARTTPELTSLSKHPHHTSRRIWPLHMIWRATGPIHGRSSGGWNWGFRPKPPAPQAETLPLGHRGLPV